MAGYSRQSTSQPFIIANIDGCNKNNSSKWISLRDKAKDSLNPIFFETIEMEGIEFPNDWKL